MTISKYEQAAIRHQRHDRDFLDLFRGLHLKPQTLCRCGHTAAAHARLAPRRELRNCMHCACPRFTAQKEEAMNGGIQQNLPFDSEVARPQVGTADREAHGDRHVHKARPEQSPPQLLQRQEQEERTGRRPRRTRSAGHTPEKKPGLTQRCACRHLGSIHADGRPHACLAPTSDPQLRIHVASCPCMAFTPAEETAE